MPSNISSKYYTYLEFLLAWYSGFKNEPCIITALCRTAFCFLFLANSAWVCLHKTQLSCSFPANPECVSGNAKASFRALEISSRGAKCCWLKGKTPISRGQGNTNTFWCFHLPPLTSRQSLWKIVFPSQNRTQVILRHLLNVRNFPLC